MLKKGKQVFKRVGLGNAVGVEGPGPVEFLCQGLGKANSNSPTGAQIGRVANDGDTLWKGPIQGPIRRRIVDDDDSIWRPGLPQQRVESLLDETGIIKGMWIWARTRMDDPDAMVSLRTEETATKPGTAELGPQSSFSGHGA